METIQWNRDKNEKLKKERSVSFEEITVCIENRQVVAIIENPKKRYKNQNIFIIAFNNYIYYVPFVRSKEGIFLKTIIPSRKLTRKYLKRKGEKNA